jgi:hypothetical protein
MNFIDLISDLRATEKQLLLNVTYPGFDGVHSTRDKLLTLDSLATIREMIDAFLDAALRNIRAELNLS